MKNLFPQFILGESFDLAYITIIDYNGHYQTEDLFEYSLN